MQIKSVCDVFGKVALLKYIAVFDLISQDSYHWRFVQSFHMSEHTVQGLRMKSKFKAHYKESP
jgi:hypothetical protein